STPAKATPNCSTARSWTATSTTPRRTTSTPCSIDFSASAGGDTKRTHPPKQNAGSTAGVFSFQLGYAFLAASGPRRAAHVDHVAVTNRGILVDEAGDQDAAVERHDLAVLLAGRRTRG